ncbi:MAG: single-stranded-DNA-specific exonuclease RecJ [bacterium]
MLEQKWNIINNHDAARVKDFAGQLNSSPILARVLLNRGIEDIETARSFFRPLLADLHDPFLMAGMHEAVRRIQRAIINKEKILIYGDYDVDGTTATSMLLRFFQMLPHPVDFYVPDRLSEGYGLSESGIQHADKQRFTLIITVDCGITAVEEIHFANSLGLDVIVCDHHQPGSELPPGVAILNPKRQDCPYPFKELAGVGVAFKLAQALQQHLMLEESSLFGLLEFVAIGSSADIVPLLDENRIFVKAGLQNLSRTHYAGLKALLETVGIYGHDLGTGQVVFMIAPRINAAGRLGDAGRAVHLLTTENAQQAKNIATILEVENRHRRDIDEQTFLEAVKIVENNFDPEKERVLVLQKEGWHPGVIGIVASRIVEKYYRPTVMIAMDNGTGKGSARSIPGFNLYHALSQCDQLMLAFGGHKYAAGLSIQSENIVELRQRLNDLAFEYLTDEQLKPKLSIDDEIRLNQITPELIKLLNRMAPFGPQNMRPVFVTRGMQAVGTPTIVGKNHLKFKVRQEGVVFDAIGFDLGHLVYRISPGENSVEMVYVIEENEWNNRKRIQLRVKDLR